MFSYLGHLTTPGHTVVMLPHTLIACCLRVGRNKNATGAPWVSTGRCSGHCSNPVGTYSLCRRPPKPSFRSLCVGGRNCMWCVSERQTGCTPLVWLTSRWLRRAFDGFDTHRPYSFVFWLTIVPCLGAAGQDGGGAGNLCCKGSRGCVCTYLLRGAPPGCRFLVPDRPPFGGRGPGWWGFVIPQR